MLTHDDRREIMNALDFWMQHQSSQDDKPMSVLVRLEEMSKSIFSGMSTIIDDLTLAQRLIVANNVQSQLATLGDNDIPARGNEYTKQRWMLLSILNTSFWTWLNTPLETPTGDALPPPIAVFSMEYVKPDPVAPPDPSAPPPAAAPEPEPTPEPAPMDAPRSRKATQKKG